MDSYSIGVTSQLNHALSFSKQSHQGIVVCQSILSYSFQRHNIPCHLTSHQVHFTTGTLSQTYQKLKLRNTDFIVASFRSIQSLQFQFFLKPHKILTSLSQPIIDKGIAIDRTKTNKILPLRSIILMKCLVSSYNGGQSCNSSIFGQRQVEFKLSNSDEKVDIVESACLGCHSGLHLTSILINNTDRTIIEMIDQLAILDSIRQEGKQMKIEMKTKQDEVEEWIKENDPAATSKKLQSSIHIRSLKFGFEVEYQKGQLFTFFAYFRTNKIGCFEFPLKYGINKGWTIKGAAMYLGQPPKKSSKTVEIIYPHLGVGLTFLGTYNNEDSLINYIYLYSPQSVQYCAACAKQFEKCSDSSGLLYDKNKKIHICKCKIVKYCSQKCRQKHYGQHLIFCEQGEL